MRLCGEIITFEKWAARYGTDNQILIKLSLIRDLGSALFFRDVSDGLVR